MAIKRILLPLRSYPAVTAVGAITSAVAIAVSLEAKISALSFAIIPHVPGSILGGVVGNVSALASAERERIVGEAERLLRTFSDVAGKAGVLDKALYRKCAPAEVPKLLIGHAHLSDVTIVPMPEGGYFDQLDSHWYLETALLDSGRPILILPHDYTFPAKGAFGTVVVAWDHTRAAARALADALPILQRARSVKLITVTNEKAILHEPPPAEIATYLAAHGIDATHDAVDGAGRDAATAVAEYVRRRSGDLLVMGGYGRTRMSELILGGMTRHMVMHAPVPLFMSH